MALPLDKLGTTYGPTTTVVDLEWARARAFAAVSQGAVVVTHGLAEVV
jgi:hypothetical protein